MAPHAHIPTGDGGTADLYVLRFGKDGSLESPKAAAEAVQAAHTATDVYVFSHGWNNLFAAALDHYTRFAEGFIDQRREFDLPAAVDARPVLIGIVWPATWFVLESEEGPHIAGGETLGDAEIEVMIDEVTDGWSTEQRATLRELLDGASHLAEKEAAQVAEVLLHAWPADDDGASSKPDVANFMSAWRSLEGGGGRFDDADDDEVGVIGVTAEIDGDTEAVQAAGGFSFDIRGALRTASVWKMKGRAGDVGKRGVGPLLARIAGPGRRVHLVGHSFGARVVLSAVAHTPGLDEHPVHSMLLLQPAVNRWCFAGEVIGKAVPGGYASVPRRVRRPIVATWSKFDQPLHEMFHLALRGDNLGEINAAAIGDTDRYGALGGYGPRGIAFAKRAAVPAGTAYGLDDIGERVVAVDGAETVGGKSAIADHGDVNSPVTWWMLHSLVRS